MKKLLLLTVAFGTMALAVSSCEQSPVPGGTDGSVVHPERIEDLPLAAEQNLAGLQEPVDVVYDTRGIPHIYGGDLLDVVRVQGYLMARDRMGQMEFLRRGVEGRLAEVAGSLDPSLLEGDKYVRILGLHREARAAYQALDASDPMKDALDAYAAGVTAHIQEIRDGSASLPGILSQLLRADLLTDWSGIDTLALARYQTYSLSFDAWAEIDLSSAAAGVREAFSGEGDRASGRAGLLHRFFSFAPAEHAFTKEDFYGPGGRSHSRRNIPVASLPSRTQLENAQRFFRSDKQLKGLLPGPDRGSNNWVVHGSKTASGNPILANDPHLALPSPPVFWMVHLNTARSGGTYDVMGLAFAGTPVVALGFNRDIAWGETVTNYDVTDVYQETITPGPEGQPGSVLHNGSQVPIEIIHEEIALNVGDPIPFDIEVVPHHGPIIPDSRTSSSALSFRWTGLDTTNEAASFFALASAKTLDEAFAALRHFEVGAQNFVFATRSGDIGWSTRSHVPVRDPRALTYDPITQNGYSPAMVLPGTGEYDWIGRLPDADIPSDRNPPRGFIATANQDGVGNTRDGNPFNDRHYLGWDFDLGHRMARISEILTELAARGSITPEEMSGLQADARSPLGAKLSPALIASLDHALEEAGSAGSHPDLTAAIAGAGAARTEQLREMRTRLAGWTSFDTPAAVEGEPSAQEIRDSVATTLFNATITRLTNLAFGDEARKIGVQPWSQMIARTLEWALPRPERAPRDDEGPETLDQLLWDDLDTPEVKETRDERILRAALSALDFLESRLGPGMDGWRWGKLHTIRFKTQIPVDKLAPSADIFSIPTLDDPDFPDGFPRHGDNFVVDACNFSLWETDHFSYDHGPTQRLVVEMTPAGPVAYNALPGGQQHDPAGTHHADETEYWRMNQAPRICYEEKDVVENAERRLRFVP